MSCVVQLRNSVYNRAAQIGPRIGESAMPVINILLAALGIVGSVAAIGGDTWQRGNVRWRDRVTRRGWLAIGCLLVAFGLGIGDGDLIEVPLCQQIGGQQTQCQCGQNGKSHERGHGNLRNAGVNGFPQA